MPARAGVGGSAVLRGRACRLKGRTRRVELARRRRQGAALGRALMESHMLVMMTVGAVMVATIVVGVVLSSPRTRYDRFGDDLRHRDPADRGAR